ncbi:MAG: hypothetical protein R2698_13360 [Microthrixaceae bacterium]
MPREGADPVRLFDPGAPDTVRGSGARRRPRSDERTPRSGLPAGSRVVRVVPDVAALRREFDYRIDAALLERAASRGVPVEVGTMVRVPLHGRLVAGWVSALDPVPDRTVDLAAVSTVSGVGPDPEIVELCRWVSWRWAGSLAVMLGAASPPRMVRDRAEPRAAVGGLVPRSVASGGERQRVRLVRHPPAASWADLVGGLGLGGPLLVIAPTGTEVRGLALALRGAGHRVAVHPEEWDLPRRAGSVVGTRTAVFAPVDDLAAIVVVDEHDEALQEEASPTWHARDVALERGRRAGVPVVLVSPVPSLEAYAAAGVDPGGTAREVGLRSASRSAERAGWAMVQVIDRRRADPTRAGLFTDELVRCLRGEGRVVCVVNRKGRAALLTCTRCSTLATCERCRSPLVQLDTAFDCPACGRTRPVVCAECGGGAFRRRRLGVSRAAEELSALLREPVVEISGRPRLDRATPPPRHGW